jgi:hypothetical protein
MSAYCATRLDRHRRAVKLGHGADRGLAAEFSCSHLQKS